MTETCNSQYGETLVQILLTKFRKFFISCRCLQCGVIKEVIRLLFFINDITVRVRRDEKRQRNEPKVSAKSAAESDLSFLSSSPSAMQEKVPFSSGELSFYLQYIYIYMNI